jgi:hypothetical protein
VPAVTTERERELTEEARRMEYGYLAEIARLNATPLAIPIREDTGAPDKLAGLVVWIRAIAIAALAALVLLGFIVLVYSVLVLLAPPDASSTPAGCGIRPSSIPCVKWPS